ncbi:Crp/Fnr family transcriptional regulator [Mesoterricola sediminis]|uniref:Crp/Fnr family transcriptional regulator n=1 Tax=Mesoterricola sediminis TaxID=2927980 RepID=UPI002931C05E|nr:Crp/Fnr family transcriptional regulator [Mesoterricola sediminis]
MRRIEYLAGLPAAEAEELAAVSELRKYTDGTPVFSQGETIPGVFVVVQGALKVFRTDGRGKVQVIDILQPGTCVGEVQVFDGGVAASGAEAHGDTECWLVPANALRLMAVKNNAVAMCMIQHFAGKVRHLISLVETLSLHSVPERVGQLILEYQGRNPGRALVEFKETQEDLAQCIGASREAFSRALRLLADLGLIQSTFPVVRILDIQKLQRYARG